MLEPNFEVAGSHRKAQPKVKVEYSAGFRKLQASQRESQTVNVAPQVMDFAINCLQQIGVENLPQLYSQTIDDNSEALIEQRRQQQSESVVRLYKNLYPSRQSNADPEPIEQVVKQVTKYADELWKVDQKYKKQPLQFILQKQLEKLHRKYNVELFGVTKTKKVQPPPNFEDIFVYFLLQETDSIKQVLKKSNAHQDNQVQIFYLWKRFLSTLNFKTMRKKYEKITISLQKIHDARSKSKFLFTLLKQPTQGLNEKLGIKQLANIVNKQFKVMVDQIKVKFDVNKNYTSPFCIEANHKIIQSKSKPIEIEQYEQINVNFKAKQVPKSTYAHPKQKIKVEHKPIQPKPFNITEKNAVMTPEQYYHFDKQRQFKASPVPKSTYHPFKPELLTEADKKARAVVNLEQAQFPKTMQGLKNYHDQQERKKLQLAQKHRKIQQKQNRHEIPNFDHLHAEQVIIFENLKQKNKKQLTIQPFKLSVGKPRPVMEDNYLGGLDIRPYSPPSRPTRPTKSTKKFDSYVKFRNDQKNDRLKKEQQKRREKEAENVKKDPYRNLLRTRMAQQFEAHPKKQVKYDKSEPMKLKVDKQKIYRERPLLMKSDLPVEEPNLPWDPIF